MIVDSEVLSNAILADALTRIGHPTTTDEAVERYIGLHWEDTCAAIEKRTGSPVPPELAEATRAAFALRAGEIGAVAGVEAFLDAVADIPKGVASSSPTRWLRSGLERLGLSHHFGDRLFSAAEHVSRGKPHPDIYLHAARALGVAPADVLVIEDTVPGASAARAAGMRVVGLCAGLHCYEGYGERLRPHADHVARDYAEVLDIIG